MSHKRRWPERRCAGPGCMNGRRAGSAGWRPIRPSIATGGNDVAPYSGGSRRYRRREIGGAGRPRRRAAQAPASPAPGRRSALSGRFLGGGRRPRSRVLGRYGQVAGLQGTLGVARPLRRANGHGRGRCSSILTIPLRRSTRVPASWRWSAGEPDRSALGIAGRSWWDSAASSSPHRSASSWPVPRSRSPRHRVRTTSSTSSRERSPSASPSRRRRWSMWSSPTSGTASHSQPIEAKCCWPRRPTGGRRGRSATTICRQDWGRTMAIPASSNSSAQPATSGGLARLAGRPCG